MTKKILTLLIAFVFLMESAGFNSFSSAATLAREDTLRPAATATSTQRPSTAPQRKGPLDGLTILRFSHVYGVSADGVSQYMEYLNKGLLERSKVTIIQLYITDRKKSLNIEIQKIGKGRLVKVPVLLKSEASKAAKGIQRHPGIFNSMQVWLSKIQVLSFIRDNLFDSWFSVFLRMIPILREYYYRSIAHDKVKEKTREILSQEGVFRDYKVDLAIGHSMFLQDNLLFAREVKKAGVAQNRKIPLIVQYHGSNRAFRNIEFKKQAKIADKVATVQGAGVPSYVRPKHAILKDGIDTDFFSPEKARPLDLGFSQPVVLLPARVSPRKGCFDIVKIVSKVLKNNKTKKPKLIFAGSIEAPIFKEKILRLAKRYGIDDDDVIFTGTLSQQEMRDYYAMSDVVVLPSERESLGRILLEGQAMEKPVIAYDVGGVSEALVDSKTGYLVKRGDIKGFANRLEELLLDEDKRASMGKAGRKFIEENYSLPALAVRTEACYLEALGSKSLPSIYNERMGGAGAALGRIVAAFISPFVILSVILPLAAIIKITSKGPAFFSQIRVGYKGRPIKIYKLRTMTIGAAPKETAVGRWIRVSHLDESPQLLSIIKGDMRWFGPRPYLPWQADKTYRNTILSIAWPGMFSSTALIRTIRSIHWQSAMDTIEYDWRDIENRSFLYNSGLILKTFFIFFWVAFNRLFNRDPNLYRDKMVKLVVSDDRQAESISKAAPSTAIVNKRERAETITDALSSDSSKDVGSVFKESEFYPAAPKAKPIDGLSLKVDIAISTAA